MKLATNFHNHLSELLCQYRLPYPKLVVSRYLERLLKERFGASVFFIGQAVYTKCCRSTSDQKEALLVVGQSEYEFKGIYRALEVASALKRTLPQLKLIRVSPTNTFIEESRSYFIDDFMIYIPPFRMGEVYALGKISIYMPYVEGFGLPLLESLNCGVPVVASNIPPFREVCGNAYPLFDDEKSAFTFAVRLLTDETFYRKLSGLGVKIASKFKKRRLILRLLKAFLLLQL